MLEAPPMRLATINKRNLHEYISVHNIITFILHLHRISKSMYGPWKSINVLPLQTTCGLAIPGPSWTPPCFYNRGLLHLWFAGRTRNLYSQVPWKMASRAKNKSIPRMCFNINSMWGKTSMLMTTIAVGMREWKKKGRVFPMAVCNSCVQFSY